MGLDSGEIMITQTYLQPSDLVLAQPQFFQQCQFLQVLNDLPKFRALA